MLTYYYTIIIIKFEYYKKPQRSQRNGSSVLSVVKIILIRLGEDDALRARLTRERACAPFLAHFRRDTANGHTH